MTDLTERYVGAVLRRISESQRTDIEAELRAAIDDAFEARLATGEPVEVAEEAVLTDLGDPDRLAANYAGRTGHLIGPELFFDYKRLLGVLIVTVVPVAVIVIGLVKLLTGEDIGSAFAGSIALAFSLVIHIGFWTTAVFVILERTGNPAPTGRWTPSNLPPLTPTKGGITLGETISTVVFLAIAIVGLTLSRDAFGVTSPTDGLIPLFEPAMWAFWLPFLIAVLIVEVVFEFVKYRIGRWNQSLAWFNVALNLAFAVPAIYLLATDRLLNREFFAELPWAGASRWIDSTIAVTMVVIVLVAAWDVFDGFRKARNARQ